MIKKLVNIIYILFIVLFLISSIIQPQGMNLIPINILAIIGLILLKKHKIEIIDINLAQSKIEIIVKNIENDILEELHKELIRNEKEEIK